MTDNNALTRKNLRAPRAGAIAGIVFPLLFIWAPMAFPLWVLLLSVHILVANMQRDPDRDGSGLREQRGTAR